jgi:chemotaxis protein CheX
MTEALILPARLDSSGAPSLLQTLLDRRGQPLLLDASAVEVIGALALEVVIAAGRQWNDDGCTLTMINPSDRYLAACAALGLRADAPWQAGAETSKDLAA